VLDSVEPAAERVEVVSSWRMTLIPLEERLRGCLFLPTRMPMLVTVLFLLLLVEYWEQIYWINQD